MRRTLFGLLLLAGCGPIAPEVSLDDADDDPVLLQRLQEGRAVYLQKCSRCHALRPVDGYSDMDWPIQVGKMETFEKVRLGVEDRAKLILYLTTMNGRD